MHSSRMRTDRSLTICCSLLPVGGDVCSQGESAGGVSAPGGKGGVCSWGMSARGGGFGGGVVSQHTLRQTPCPPVDRILDTRL